MNFQASPDDIPVELVKEELEAEIVEDDMDTEDNG